MEKADEGALRLLYAGTEKNKARCEANRAAAAKEKQYEKQLAQDEKELFG